MDRIKNILAWLHVKWWELQCLFKGHDWVEMPEIDVNCEMCMRCIKMRGQEKSENR